MVAERSGWELTAEEMDAFARASEGEWETGLVETVLEEEPWWRKARHAAKVVFLRPELRKTA